MSDDELSASGIGGKYNLSIDGFLSILGTVMAVQNLHEHDARLHAYRTKIDMMNSYIFVHFIRGTTMGYVFIYLAAVVIFLGVDAS